VGNINSGRKPIPAGIRVLTGRPAGVKRNPPAVEPPAGEVLVPAGISPAGREVWDRLAPIAIAMHTLTPADADAFRSLCELLASLELASSAKSAPGFHPVVVSENAEGVVTTSIHAATRAEIQLAGAVRPYFERFGLDPASRCRISVGAPAPASKWGALAK
jgi:hypothetical protein